MITPASQPGQPDTPTLARVVAAIDPALRLTASWALTGGVSSQVTALVAKLPQGAVQRLVVRQYGRANLRSDPRSAAHEYQLLALLHGAGLPVPRPRQADESRAILPVPYLVTDFLEGEICTDPTRLTLPVGDFTGQLAAFLAALHSAGVTRALVPYLTDIATAATNRLGTRPARLDADLSEAAVRAALAGIWPPPQLNAPVLLHGDFWPGNVLWQRGALAGVLDWEDATFGDPLADLCLTRMELCMAFGTAAMHSFTAEYRDRAPGLDVAAQPHWDLYAALRHAGRMSSWGLAETDLARLRAGHQAFTAAALAQLAGPGDSRPLA
jgi:aminoglycoside phosphotransferase (APT) family kinase protein